jgi:hypothetical protein
MLPLRPQLAPRLRPLLPPARAPRPTPANRIAQVLEEVVVAVLLVAATPAAQDRSAPRVIAAAPAWVQGMVEQRGVDASPLRTNHSEPWRTILFRS